MEQLLSDFLSQSEWPLLSALLLGLMTAISPCPLATNITAIGFISIDLENKNRVFISGLVYTMGRVFAYTGIAFIFLLGANQFEVSGFLQKYGEKIIGPLLIIVGLIMLDFIGMKFPRMSILTKRYQEKGKLGYLDAFLLGVIFALAFCPYSGVLYFGMLIPLTISSTEGLFLPIVFAIATGIPVIIISWLIAFSVAGIGTFYNKLKTFEIWFRRVIAILFIAIGIYYIIIIYF